MRPGLTPAELAAVDAAIERALATGDESGLEILGYGEISTVVAWPTGSGPQCAKRLPLFPDRAAFEAYAACVATYLERLAAAGIEPLPTEVQGLDRPGGAVAGYCVQRVQPAGALLHRALGELPRDAAVGVFEDLLDLVEHTVSPRLGLDGQVSNWVLEGRRLLYLDVSTPLMRDGEGREALDVELFLASLPWALRGVVRRFLLARILGTYYRARSVILDLLGNLHKERLDHLVEPFLERANARLEPPITPNEVLAYYREDARMWELLQRLRRLDRAWQRKVRGRTYPFLLPGRIERHV